jgi:hypothetical protein
MSCDSDIEQSQVEDNTFTNPVLPLQVYDKMPMKRLNSTSVNLQHSTISSPNPLIVQLPKGISISPCNFSVGLSTFTQNHSSSSGLQRLSEVELKCFDPGGMIPLFFLFYFYFCSISIKSIIANISRTT